MWGRIRGLAAAARALPRCMVCAEWNALTLSAPRAQAAAFLEAEQLSSSAWGLSEEARGYLARGAPEVQVFNAVAAAGAGGALVKEVEAALGADMYKVRACHACVDDTVCVCLCVHVCALDWRCVFVRPRGFACISLVFARRGRASEPNSAWRRAQVGISKCMKNRWLTLNKGEGRLTRALAGARVRCACGVVRRSFPTRAASAAAAGEPEDELRAQLALVAAARAADDVPAELSSALKKRQLIAIECASRRRRRVQLVECRHGSSTPRPACRRRRTTFYRLVKGPKFALLRTKAAAELTREMLDRCGRARGRPEWCGLGCSPRTRLPAGAPQRRVAH
jgi:hypothetical protein